MSVLPRQRSSSVPPPPGLAFAELLPARLLIWTQLLLATPVVLCGGWPCFQRGWASLCSRHLNMFTLIAMGTGAAYLYSVVATLAPGLSPESLRGHGGHVGVYFEAAAVITTLVLVGQVLELKARGRTSSRPGDPARRSRGGHPAR